MRHIARIAWTALALAAGPASLAQAPAAASAAHATEAHAVGPTGVVLPASDPMATEMQHAIEAQQRDYVTLVAQLAQAKHEDDAFAIQSQLQQRQIGLQVDLLRIQAAYARRAGRDRLAWQLDRTVDVLIAPDAPKPHRDERGKL